LVFRYQNIVNLTTLVKAKLEMTNIKEMKYPKTLIEEKELSSSHTYDPGCIKKPNSAKSSVCDNLKSHAEQQVIQGI